VLNKYNAMKILYVITKSDPYGGAQKYIYDLAMSAQKAGHDVAVACGGDGPMITKLVSSQIEVHKVDSFFRDMSFLSDPKALFEVMRIILKKRPEVLHVTSSKAGAIGAIAGRLTLVRRIIFTSHGLTVDEVWRSKWQRSLIYLGTWLTMILAHTTIMISTETYNRSREMWGLRNKIALVKNGISNISFIERKKAKVALLKLPTNSFWVGGLGELHPNKNWSALIKAAKNLPPNTHVIIIGEGEDRAKLEDLIIEEKLSSKVHLLGYLDGAPYLKAFDVFVLPSLKEGLPYVLLEAGLAELPVVASNLPGNHDVIDTGKTGFLIEPTPKLLSTTISILARDEVMRRRLGNNLEKMVSTEFSLERMFDETLKVYDFNKSAV